MIEGNGAREALIEIMRNEQVADYLLTKLWVEGFKVVPLELEEYDNAIRRSDGQVQKRRVTFRQ